MDLASKRITAADIKGFLHERHNRTNFGTHEGIGVSELVLSGQRSDNRVDYWAIECWKSKGYTKTAYEIKVSRSDWLAELKAPQKRRQALFISNLFYFIAPKDVVKVEEVPIECGLITVEWCSNQNVVREALWRDEALPTWRFVINLARRLLKENK